MLQFYPHKVIVDPIGLSIPSSGRSRPMLAVGAGVEPREPTRPWGSTECTPSCGTCPMLTASGACHTTSCLFQALGTNRMLKTLLSWRTGPLTFIFTPFSFFSQGGCHTRYEESLPCLPLPRS